MDLTALFNTLSLGAFVSLSGAVVILTQLLKAMPVAWTTEKPKVVAWLASTLVVYFLGMRESASVATMLTVIPVLALGAHGLYDVLKSFWAWATK